MAAPPKLPGYSLKQVLADRNALMRAIAPHFGSVLEGSTYQAFLEAAATALAGLPARVLPAVAGGLVGQRLDKAMALEWAWRLAGNVRRLRRGEPVFPWMQQAEEEWMPLHVARARPGRNRKDEPGHSLWFRIWAGSACPATVATFWSRPQGRFVARRIGYNARAGRPYKGGQHFVGMLLYGLFEPRLCAERPMFRQVRVTAGMQAHNVALIDGRREKPCRHFGYSHPCESCTIGYDRCPMGTHPASYYRDFCLECQQESAFDPDDPTRCVACTIAEATRPRDLA